MLRTEPGPSQKHEFRLTPEGEKWGEWVDKDYEQRSEGGCHLTSVGLAASGLKRKAESSAPPPATNMSEFSSCSTADPALPKRLKSTSSLASRASSKADVHSSLLAKERKKTKAREMLRTSPHCVRELEQRGARDGPHALEAVVHSETRKTFRFNVSLECDSSKKIVKHSCKCQYAAKHGLVCKHIWAVCLYVHDDRIRALRDSMPIPEEAALRSRRGRGGAAVARATAGRGRGRGGRGSGGAARGGAAASDFGGGGLSELRVMQASHNERERLMPSPFDQRSWPHGNSEPPPTKGQRLGGDPTLDIHACRRRLLDSSSPKAKPTLKTAVAPRSIELLVDSRERKNESCFLGLFTGIEEEVHRWVPGGAVERERLPLADYLWKCSEIGRILLAVAVERKSVRDLV